MSDYTQYRMALIGTVVTFTLLVLGWVNKSGMLTDLLCNSAMWVGIPLFVFVLYKVYQENRPGK